MRSADGLEVGRGEAERPRAAGAGEAERPCGMEGKHRQELIANLVNMQPLMHRLLTGTDEAQKCSTRALRRTRTSAALRARNSCCSRERLADATALTCAKKRA